MHASVISTVNNYSSEPKRCIVSENRLNLHFFPERNNSSQFSECLFPYDYDFFNYLPSTTFLKMN